MGWGGEGCYSGECSSNSWVCFEQVQALTAEQIADFKAAFDTFDADGSGSIDADELGHIMTTMGKEMSRDEIEDLIRNVDEDGQC